MLEISKQFKYAFRHGAVLRYSVFGLVLAINLVFGVLAYFGVLGFAAAVTAVSLSGVGLAAVIIVNFIAGATNIKGILSSPIGYSYALIPVKSGKILFSRMFLIIIQDLLLMFISIIGTVWLSFCLAEVTGAGDAIAATELMNIDILSEVFTAFIYGGVQYAYIYMLIVFAIVLQKSVFFAKKGKTFLTVAGVLLVYYLLSLFDFALAPFAAVENWFIFYNFMLYNWTGFVLHGLLVSAKTVLLFFVTARLMDRRMNY